MIVTLKGTEGTVANLEADASVTAYRQRQDMSVIRANRSNVMLIDVADIQLRILQLIQPSVIPVFV